MGNFTKLISTALFSSIGILWMLSPLRIGDVVALSNETHPSQMAELVDFQTAINIYPRNLIDLNIIWNTRSGQSWTNAVQNAVKQFIAELKGLRYTMTYSLTAAATSGTDADVTDSAKLVQDATYNQFLINNKIDTLVFDVNSTQDVWSALIEADADVTVGTAETDLKTKTVANATQNAVQIWLLITDDGPTTQVGLFQGYTTQAADKHTDLPVLSALWQSGNTIRYTLDSPADLSGVDTSYDYIFATGCDNAPNDGQYLITAVNDGSDYVDITNTDRSSSADDDTTSGCVIDIYDDAPDPDGYERSHAVGDFIKAYEKTDGVERATPAKIVTIAPAAEHMDFWQHGAITGGCWNDTGLAVSDPSEFNRRLLLCSMGQVYPIPTPTPTASLPAPDGVTPTATPGPTPTPTASLPPPPIIARLPGS